MPPTGRTDYKAQVERKREYNRLYYRRVTKPKKIQREMEKKGIYDQRLDELEKENKQLRRELDLTRERNHDLLRYYGTSVARSRTQ